MLGVPTVRDRVCQQALRNRLEPIFEPVFDEANFGYRYLAQAANLAQPVPVEEASIPITLKLPPRTVRVLRSYAARSGLTLGEIVTRALEAFLNALGKHG
jgi:hypothetical protein